MGWGSEFLNNFQNWAWGISYSYVFLKPETFLLFYRFVFSPKKHDFTLKTLIFNPISCFYPENFLISCAFLYLSLACFLEFFLIFRLFQHDFLIKWFLYIYKALLCVSVRVSLCLSVLAKNLPLPQEAHRGCYMSYCWSHHIFHRGRCGDLRWNATFDVRRPLREDIWNHEVMKYHVMKYHVMKYDVMKYDVMKYEVMKYDVLRYGVMKYDVM